VSKGEHRRFTAEHNLQILTEAGQPEVTGVSTQCVALSVFYRWRAVTQGGSAGGS
jgi:hypothetical protein